MDICNSCLSAPNRYFSISPAEVHDSVLIPGNKIRVRALPIGDLSLLHSLRRERHTLSGAWKFVTVSVGPAGAFEVLIGSIFVWVQIQTLGVGLRTSCR